MRNKTTSYYYLNILIFSHRNKSLLFNNLDLRLCNPIFLFYSPYISYKILFYKMKNKEIILQCHAFTIAFIKMVIFFKIPDEQTKALKRYHVRFRLYEIFIKYQKK